MMHPTMARVALGLPARPSLFTLATGGGRKGRLVRVGDLVEMANGWVAAKSRSGGVKAVNEATGRVLYGERARRALEGGGGGGGAGGQAPAAAGKKPAAGKKAAGKKPAEGEGGGKRPAPDDIERVEKEGLSEQEAADFDDMVNDMPWKDVHGLAEQIAKTSEPRALRVLAKHLGVSDKGGRKAVARRAAAAVAKRKVAAMAEKRPEIEAKARSASPAQVRSLDSELDLAIADGNHEAVAAVAAGLGLVPHADPQRNRKAIVARVKALRRQPRKPKEGAAPRTPTKKDIDRAVGGLGG